jgi:hypothetical protein
MPPKSAPSQAGKFRPLKRPVKKTDSSPSDSATASAGAGTDGDTDGSRGRVGVSGQSPPRGGGRGTQQQSQPAGRGGRGRGGRGGRGGRFVIPTGTAFFTGEAAKRSDASAVVADGGAYVAGNIPRVTTGAAASSKTSRAARSTAARTKGGEGEEIIVGEMVDLDEYGGDREEGAKGALRSSKRSGDSHRFHDDNQLDEVAVNNAGSLDLYSYDSDSSMEMETVGRRQKHSGDSTMPPTQLPFPLAPHQQTMYDCQEERFDEEKKMSDGEVAAASVTNISSKLSDPPLRSPFLNLSSVSEELKQIETNSWFLMKFPTRLPLLDTSSSSTHASKKKAARVKSESNDDNYGDPDAVGSSNIDTSIAGGASFLASSSVSNGPLGFDDTLKDTAAGRYGKIVVRKSGKTELIIGGGGGSPKVSIDRVIVSIYSFGKFHSRYVRSAPCQQLLIGSSSPT